MDIGYAVTYVFEDRKWIQKIVILAVVCFLSSLSIVIIGLPALILATGYMVRIARNVRNGLPRPLPAWDMFGEMFKDGVYVLLAMVLYNLPLLLIVGFIWLLIAGTISGIFGAGVNFVTLCCSLPIVILYCTVVWSMLATGVSEYIETNQPRALYRPVHIWDVMQANAALLRQWALYAALVNVILSILGFIPCLGWLALAIFAVPVHGHLFGQFVHQLSVTNHPKAKPAKPRPKRT